MKVKLDQPALGATGRTAGLRRSQYMSATALGRAVPWPAALLVLPMVLGPSGSHAATFNVSATCALPPGPGVCSASSLGIPSPGKAGDTIAFQGGALTLDLPTASYAQKVTLGTSPNTNTLNQAGHSTTFTGVISGAGGNVTITNLDQTTGSPLTGGSVTFNKAETYTGSTTVTTGATLSLGTSGKIANSSGLADNGTFNISGAGGNVTIASLSGNGTVTLGPNNLILAAAAGTFGGAINGSGGGLTISGGTETLSGNNTYTGVTTIGAGGTLAMSGTGSIALSSKITDNGAFDISKSTGNVTITTLAGSGTVNLGGNSVILSKASTTFSGSISGTGGVTVASGSQTLSAANTYIGTTSLNSSSASLVLTKAGSIAGSSVADSGIFDISGTKGTSIVSLSGSGFVNLGSQVLTLSNASGIFTGTIVGSGTKNGIVIAAGTETLNGANLFGGTTTVSPTATLRGIGSVSGALVNGGTVRPFDSTTGSPGTFTVGGNYSQSKTGSLNISIGGTAAGTYGHLSVSGTVALAGSLDVDLVNSFAFPQGKTTYDILDYRIGKNTLSGDFDGVSFNGKTCTGDGVDNWICGVGLTFTESFGTPGVLDLIVAQAPEPDTALLLGVGLGGLLLRRRQPLTKLKNSSA